MRRLLPTPADEVDPWEEYALPAGAAWLRANMVSTIDGSVTDGSGLSGGISGAADRRVFRALRGLSDAVVVGARTAVAEGYRRAGVPVVLLSRTLDLDLTTPLLASAPEEGQASVVVVHPSSAPPDARALVAAHADRIGGVELLEAGDEALDLSLALSMLRERGLHRLLCEGGPTVLAALLAEELVDELCVTTSPLVVAGDAGRIVSGGHALPMAVPWELVSLYEEASFLFARWQCRTSARGSSHRQGASLVLDGRSSEAR